MMLSDRDLETRIGELFDVQPRPLPKAFQPASIDLTLGEEFAFWLESNPLEWAPSGEQRSRRIIDPINGEVPLMRKKREKHEFHLSPGEFVLGSTVERVRLGNLVAARVEGRSSLGRLGLMVHATAGFIDPGFEGNITLEIYNLSNHVIVLRPGMSVCQLAFHLLSSECRRPYGPERGSRYQGQDGVQESKWPAG